MSEPSVIRIPAEFEVRWRHRGTTCRESSEDWTRLDAVSRAHELVAEGARGIRVMRRPVGGCCCDWRLYVKVGRLWCWLRRRIGIRCCEPRRKR
ncbi:MAG TPA: hypothetical protein VGG54_22525 [Trebonia sp.]|jgi:hypothetical protein